MALDEDENKLEIDDFREIRVYSFRRKTFPEIQKKMCEIGTCDNPVLTLNSEYSSGYAHFRFCIKHILMSSRRIEVDNDKLKIYKGQIKTR